MSFSHKLIDTMINVAKDSDISFKLSAVLLRNTKPVGPVLPNTDRMCCRGKVISSMHAEANALMNHFGKSLYHQSNKWYVLPERTKGTKV